MPVRPPGCRNSGCTKAKAWGPLTRITPIPPLPGGVAIAAIVSFCIVGLYNSGQRGPSHLPSPPSLICLVGLLSWIGTKMIVLVCRPVEPSVALCGCQSARGELALEGLPTSLPLMECGFPHGLRNEMKAKRQWIDQVLAHDGFRSVT